MRITKTRRSRRNTKKGKSGSMKLLELSCGLVENGDQYTSPFIPEHDHTLFCTHFFVFLRDLRVFVMRIYVDS